MAMTAQALNYTCRLATIALAVGVTLTTAPMPAARAASDTARAVTVVGAQGYTEETAATSCGSSVFECKLIFSAVPAGKSFVVTNISCGFTADGTTPLLVHKLTVSQNINARSNQLTPLLLGTSAGGFRNFSSNNQVLKLYKAGERPTVYVKFDSIVSSIDLGCEIAGQIAP